MDVDEYKNLIRNKNVLNYATLTVTIEELERVDDKRLIKEINRILSDNKIDKPKFHNKEDDHVTDHYRVDLNSDDIEFIVSMFGHREVESLDKNYEVTRAAAFYGTMLDNWNRMLLD